MRHSMLCSSKMYLHVTWHSADRRPSNHIKTDKSDRPEITESIALTEHHFPEDGLSTPLLFVENVSEV